MGKDKSFYKKIIAEIIEYSNLSKFAVAVEPVITGKPFAPFVGPHGPMPLPQATVPHTFTMEPGVTPRVKPVATPHVEPIAAPHEPIAPGAAGKATPRSRGPISTVVDHPANISNLKNELTLDAEGNVKFKNPAMEARWFDKDGKLVGVSEKTFNEIGNKFKKETFAKQKANAKRIAKIEAAKANILNAGRFSYKVKNFIASPKGIAAAAIIVGVGVIYKLLTGKPAQATDPVAKELTDNANDLAGSIGQNINGDKLSESIDDTIEVLNTEKSASNPATQKIYNLYITMLTNLNAELESFDGELMVDNPQSLSGFMPKVTNFQHKLVDAKLKIDKFISVLNNNPDAENLNTQLINLNSNISNMVNVIEGLKKK